MPDPFTIHLLTEAANTSIPCPGNAQCRCPTHSDRMHPTTPVKRCTGHMTCTCPRCNAQRFELVAHPKPEPRQPWQPRPARKAA